jgi:hypothetical protein
MKSAFGLAMLEGRDEEDLKANYDPNVLTSVLRSVVNDNNLVNLIRGNRYYQGRLDRVMPLLSMMV